MTTTPAGLDSIHDEVIRDIDRQMRLDREAAAPVFCSLKVTNLKVVPSMSEETVAYTATIKFGPIVLAYAKNDGHGGNTFIHAAEGRRELLHDLERRWMEAIGPDSTNCAVRFDLEAWVDDAAAEKLKEIEDKREEARIRRWISSRVNRGYVVFRVGDEWASCYPTTGSKNAPRSKAKWEASIKAKHPTAGNFFFPSWWTA